MKAQKKKPNIVSVHLAPESKAALDQACKERGMTIKSLLGRLIEWFNSMNKTEQSIVLGQVEQTDVRALAELLVRRRARGGNAKLRSAARRARR
jgi:hypothetical protein